MTGRCSVGKILQLFKSKKTRPKEGSDFQDRADRIKASLERINTLLAELKKEDK